MNEVFAFLMAAALAGPALAQDSTAASAESGAETMLETGVPQLEAIAVTLEEFQWLNRPIVVFADTPADPRFQEQMGLLLARQDELIARDVVIITDTDPAARSEIRLKLRPRGFQMTLIGKDGGVKLRKPFPWDVREISRTIDKMPLRQQEIRQGGS
jgi:hypothetical protein